MAKTSIIITSTDTTGKTLQKSFTDVNPEATNAQLVTFAQGLNSLTTNTYNGTSRVNKINCDAEASAAVKTTPTLTVTPNELSRSNTEYVEITGNGSVQRMQFSISVSYNGDGSLYVPIASTGNAEGVTIGGGTNGQYLVTFTWKTNQMSAEVIRIPIGATETDNYKAAVTYLIVNL